MRWIRARSSTISRRSAIPHAFMRCARITAPVPTPTTRSTRPGVVGAATAAMRAPPLPEKLLQQRRRLAFADRGIDLRCVVAGGGGKEAHAGLDRAALGVGRAEIEPADARERDCAGAHRAG